MFTKKINWRKKIRMEEFLEFLEANRNTGKVNIVADTRDKHHHCVIVCDPSRRPCFWITSEGATWWPSYQDQLPEHPCGPDVVERLHQLVGQEWLSQMNWWKIKKF
jgi:hypothetical protein